MATPEAALVAALRADPSVAALVGARVFAEGGKQGVPLPYITIQSISWAGEPHLDGPSTLDHPTLQIDCWAEKGLDALTVRNAVRTALDGRETTAAGLTFYADLQDQRGPTLDMETKNFGASLDLKLWHER